jgi:hypothetical protein
MLIERQRVGARAQLPAGLCQQLRLDASLPPPPPGGRGSDIRDGDGWCPDGVQQGAAGCLLDGQRV